MRPKVHVVVWIASRLLGAGGRTFTKQELLRLIEDKFGDTRPALSTHISSYCVASAKADPGAYRYLTVVGRGRYRVYRPGDPVHASKVSAPTHPEFQDIPEDYRYLLDQERGAREPASQTERTMEPDETLRGGEPFFRTEEDVERFVFALLADGFGGSPEGPETGISIGAKQYRLVRQGETAYRVGDMTITHKSDLLVEDAERRPRVSIEVVFRSSVTDHFKARAFDFEHMKREHPELKGVVVYVKSDKGISPERAREVSYTYDFFFSLREADAANPASWASLTERIREWLG